MKALKVVIQHISDLLKMEQEPSGEKIIFSRTRTIKIGEGDLIRSSQFNWMISFENYQSNGLARNHAELYLTAKECEVFLPVLIQDDYPLPSDYHQWQEEKAGVIYLQLKSIEPPEDFAARVAAALQEIESV